MGGGGGRGEGGGGKLYTVVPLLKDTLAKGHLSHKVTELFGSKRLILPVTKGHLSNKDRIICLKGCPH